MLIRLRRGSAAAWAAANPVLADGEPAADPTSGTLKIGDGVTAYNSLPTIGAGGGGTSVKIRRATKTDGNIAITATSGSWVELGTDLRITIPAVAGDWLETGFDALRSSTNFFIDVATLDGTATPINWLSSETGTPDIEGSVSFYPPGNAFWTSAGATMYQVKAGDIVSGNVTYGLFYKGTATGTVYADTNYRFRWWVKNLGQG